MKKDDFKIVAYYLGKIIRGTGLLLLIPMFTALCCEEYEPLIDLTISFLVFMSVGYGFELIGTGFKSTFRWLHGLVIASASWLVLMVLSALPYYLSGHFLSYLDAMFDVMSGFTTTGLALIQDVDHVSNGINMWRHLLTFVGGQGMVVLALSFLITKGTGTLYMYVGEAKDEKLLPNVTDTAKAIWFISLVYLAVGTAALMIAGLGIGLSVENSFLHGLWIFMGAWSTGGFAPQSQNILYYHSAIYECVTIIFMVIGSFNFGLHHAVLKGDKKEIYKNIEIISFITTLTISCILVFEWFSRQELYTNSISMFRRVFYQIISAHTTTGFMNVYAGQFLQDWGDFGIIIMSIIMVIGASASSTAGGIKGIRIGLFFKGLKQTIRKLISPECKVCIEKYHFGKTQVLSDELMRNVLTIIVLYLITLGIGVLGGVYYGYGLSESLFEAASVTGNVGLSIGITTPTMPSGLKIIYIIIMWLARLEFISALALVWNMVSGVKNIWEKISRKYV